MSEEQFIKLFRYLEEFRAEMSLGFDALALQSSLGDLSNAVESFVKRIDASET